MTVLQQRPGPTATSPAPQLPPPGPATPPGVGLEHDFLSTASSALRRLHFKSAGGSRVNRDRSRYQSSQQPPVPKLVIMGSSTSSNNTINTSTDSANTVNTMVTGTDCDQDTDTETAAAPRLARKSIDDILCASLSLEKEDDFFSESSGTDDSHKHPAPPPPTPLLGAAASIKEPRFVFIKTEAETDEEEEINIDQEEMYSLLNKSITVTTATVHNGNDAEGDADTTSQHSHHSHHHHHHHRHSSKRRSRHGSTKSISSLPRSPSSNNNNNNKNNHHRQKYSSTVIPQPPDLRVDFFSESLSTFTPVTVMEDGQDALLEEVVVTADGAKTVLLVDGGVVSDYEGRGGGEDAMNGAGISNRSSLSGVPAKRGAGESAAGGFFTSSAAVVGGGGGDGGIGINTTSASVTVNTTANPLVNITVGTSPTSGLVSRQYLHHHPKQSIVVQQSSIGGSPTVATVLLKNCAALQQDIGCLNKTKQREENMKQLLEVANTLTLQELHDFEMKYGSPHHSRSQSVKTPGSRSNPSGRPNYLCLPQQRSRVASMPNTGVEEEYYRLRHFSITGKGIVNRGDSLKSKRSKSNTSVTSSNSSHSTEHLTTALGGGGGNSYPGSARTSATTSLASSRESSTSNPGPLPYRVVMLGAAAVGKSSLISQFMTSEYLHAYDTSLDDEFGEKTVSVLLDGDESELTFIDHPCSEMSPENCIITYEPHAYCVVYSTVDRTSLRVAEETLQYLWKTDSVSSKAVILVGNKTDLVRSRAVTTDEGKNMATSYDCKFIETSVGINHNVDELLVGLLTQIRLKLENPERSRDLFRKRSCSRKKGSRNKSPLGANSGHKPYRGSRTSTSLKVKGLLGKVWARDSKSKSCENLHVL